MRTNQLALRLEDTSQIAKLWMSLPASSRMSVARAYARLCVRAAKVVAPVREQKGGGEPCSLKR